MQRIFTRLLVKYIRFNLFLIAFILLGGEANAQFPYGDTFRNATSPDLVFGGTNGSAFLTASATAVTAFGATGTAGTGQLFDADPADAGYLRLTRGSLNQNGFAYNNNRTFSTTDGLDIAFEYYTHTGSTAIPDIYGGDGITFFLFDATTPVFTPGFFGGSLGYAQNGGSGAGVPNGFLGIGLDEFGNFANPGASQRAGGPGKTPSAITIRGDGNGTGLQQGAFVGNTNYEFISTVNTVNLVPSFSLTSGVAAATRTTSPERPNGGFLTSDAGYRKVRVVIEPNGVGVYKLNVYISYNVLGGAGNYVADRHIVVDQAYTPNVIPGNVKYGFTAGTGTAYNVHEIRAITVVVPASSPKVPTALTVAKSGPENSNITFAQSDFYNSDFNLTKFTDPNGDALNKIQIKSLPNPLHGVLKLAPGGTVVNINEEISYANIPNLYFEPVNEYDGAASFTWNGADPGGLYAVADAAVNITLTPIPSITPANLSVCLGATQGSLVYTNMTDGANEYTIDFDAAAQAAGFLNVVYTALPASPITITVPGAATPTIYSATVTVRNTVAATTGTPTGFTVTVKPLAVAADIAVSAPAVCFGSSAVLTPSLAVANSITSPVYTWYANADKTGPITTGGAFTVAGNGVLTVTGLAAGPHTYYVAVSGTEKCENAGGTLQSVTVTVKPLAVAADIAVSAPAVC
ncbi:MAG: hypothetical protein Q8S11_15445, partial [Daejeonella sp.]|uniref:Ig-like domain-containing protein n=1 Tax=Daejeonella sp. TaxID=2805397 RepID=UPI0027362B1F